MMITSTWNTFVYEPLYNLLMFFVSILPGHSVGLAIILLTIFIKFILFPFTAKAIKAQRAMKELEPEIKKLRDKHKDDRQKLAQSTMELYRERGVSPFSGCLPILIQIPIIIGLYILFLKGLETINGSILYSFVPEPLSLDMHFLIFDLAAKSMLLALLAGVTQYIQTDISLGKTPPPTPTDTDKRSFQEDFARSMQMQMRYVLPVMIGFIAYTTSAAVALYWTVSNILSIGQELWMKKNGTK